MIGEDEDLEADAFPLTDSLAWWLRSPPWERGRPRFVSRTPRGDFSGSSLTSDL